MECRDACSHAVLTVRMAAAGVLRHYRRARSAPMTSWAGRPASHGSFHFLRWAGLRPHLASDVIRRRMAWIG